MCLLFSLVYVYVIHLLPHPLRTVELICLRHREMQVLSDFNEHLLVYLDDALLVHGVSQLAAGA